MAIIVAESFIPKVLGDKNKDARLLAAHALGEIGDTRAVESLIKALGDVESTVRWSVPTALGKIGDGRAIEPCWLPR